MAGPVLAFPDADFVTAEAPKMDGFIGHLAENDDGVYAGDDEETGYNLCGKLTFDEGAKRPAVVVQTIRNRNAERIHLGFYVRHAHTFDENNLIMVCVRPGRPGVLPHGPETRRFDIFPVWDQGTFGAEDPDPSDPGQPGSGGDSSLLDVRQLSPHPVPATWHVRNNRLPRQVSYYKGVQPPAASPGKTPWAAIASLPPAVEVKVRSSRPEPPQPGYAAECAWSVELQLPLAPVGGSDWIVLGDEFKIFIDVVRIDAVPTSGGLEGPYNTQYVWPDPHDPADKRRLKGFLNDTVDFVVNPAWYGDAQVPRTNPSKMVGVQFKDASPLSVGVRDSLADPSLPLDYHMKSATADHPSTGVNRLVAKVENTGLTDAHDVTATFLFAQWGIGAPLDWQDATQDGATYVPGGTIQPKLNIPSKQQVEFLMDWPHNKVPEIYTRTGPWGSTGGDHCAMVVLASQHDVTFAQAIIRRNILFESLSKFEHDAIISARGHPAPADGRPYQKFVLFTHVRSLHEIVSEIGPGGRPVEVDRMVGWEHSTHGFVDVGEELTIDGTSYASLSPAGAYAHTLKHPKANDELVHDVELKGNDPVAMLTGGHTGVHALRVPVGGRVTLRHKLKTRPAKPAPGSGLLAWLIWLLRYIWYLLTDLF